MAQLYFDNKQKQYFMVLDHERDFVYCSVCEKLCEVDKYYFLHRSWSKKEFSKKVYCQNCIKDHKKHIYDEFLCFQLTNDSLPDSFVVFDTPPRLKVSTSVFDAALSNDNIQSDTSSTLIIDNTRLAGRESIECARVGCEVAIPELLTSDGDIVSELLQIKNAKLIIPELLENKKVKEHG